MPAVTRSQSKSNIVVSEVKINVWFDKTMQKLLVDSNFEMDKFEKLRLISEIYYLINSYFHELYDLNEEYLRFAIVVYEKMLNLREEIRLLSKSSNSFEEKMTIKSVLSEFKITECLLKPYFILSQNLAQKRDNFREKSKIHMKPCHSMKTRSQKK